MTVNGAMIKQMVKVLIIMLMVLDMKAFGKMIFSMATEKKHGPMAPFIKETTNKGRNLDMVDMSGMTDQNTKVTGLKTK